MKKYFLLFILFIAFTNLHAQTHVSGGIWANTTWTLVNSPYIVDSSVVVLPGYILTIEPGVVVKFADHQGLEIRQAQLIAMGTVADSITFTSNSSSPTPNIYPGITLNGGTMPSQIGYCNFYYANHGIACNSLAIPVKHCKAMYNYDGISGIGYLDSCEMKYNTHWAAWGFDSVANCKFLKNYDGMFQCFHINNCIVDSSSDIGITMNNGPITNSFVRYGNIGISRGNPVTIDHCVITNNHRGIELNTNLTMTNSIIDSNVVGIYNHSSISSNQHNYIADCHIAYNTTGIDIWITTGFAGNGSVFTRNNIDYNDVGISLYQVVELDTFYCNTICFNTSYGFKNLISLNTSCVVNNYWCTPDSASVETIIYDVYDNLNSGFVYFMPIDSTCAPVISTSIHETTEQHFMQIYPNPTENSFTISTELNHVRLEIFDMSGEILYDEQLESKHKTVHTSFSAGIYFVKLDEGERNVVRKLIVQ